MHLNRRLFLGLAALLGLTSRTGAAAPAPRILIMPDITAHEHGVTKTAQHNCWTIHHSWMMRWNLDTGQAQRAHVNSRAYRRWLIEHPPENGIPPHIQFGGAVVAGKGDPTFHARWERYARETFV